MSYQYSKIVICDSVIDLLVNSNGGFLHILGKCSTWEVACQINPLFSLIREKNKKLVLIKIDITETFVHQLWILKKEKYLGENGIHT